MEQMKRYLSQITKTSYCIQMVTYLQETVPSCSFLVKRGCFYLFEYIPRHQLVVKVDVSNLTGRKQRI